MSAKKKNQLVEKSKKITYTFTLSPDNVKKLEDKIGYNSRSKIVNELISDFVNKKKRSARQTNLQGS